MKQGGWVSGRGKGVCKAQQNNRGNPGGSGRRMFDGRAEGRTALCGVLRKQIGLDVVRISRGTGST